MRLKLFKGSYRVRTEGVCVGLRENATPDCGRQSIFHLAKEIKRRQRNTIISLPSPDAVPVTSTPGIRASLTAHYRRAFSSIKVDETSMRTSGNAVSKEFPSAAAFAMGDTITLQELHNAVCWSGKWESPGLHKLPAVLRDNVANTQERPWHCTI